MHPSQFAVLAHSADSTELLMVARDLCTAAALMTASGRRNSAAVFVERATELLELRSLCKQKDEGARRPEATLWLDGYD
jgi:hypothetical protein